MQDTKIYKVNGTDYEVSKDREDQFLKDFPNAILPEKISPWQNFKNNISNALETALDPVEFYGFNAIGKDEQQVIDDGEMGMASSVSIATSMLFETVFGRENMKQWHAKNPDFWNVYEPTDSKAFEEAVRNYEIEKSKTKKTLSFAESENIADFLSVALGTIVNVGGSVAYNLGTLGAGFFMDFASENFIETNKELAKQNNLSLDDFLKTMPAKVDKVAPLTIAALQGGLEYFGTKKIVKGLGLSSQYKALTKGLGKNLLKAIKYNKTARLGVDLLSVGSTEAITEMTQHGLGVYNSDRAKDKNANIIESVIGGMLSPEGIESGLQGFFGGAGLRGGGRSLKGLKSIRNSVDDLEVASEINALVILRKKFNQIKDQDVKAGLQEKINILELSINDKIKRGNKIYDELNNKSLSEIETLGDLADAAAFRITELNRKLDEGLISKLDHEQAIEGLNSKYNKNRNKIGAIINERNVRKQVDILSEKGIKGKVSTLTTQELENKVKEIDKKSTGFSKNEDGSYIVESVPFGSIIRNQDGTYEIIINKDKPAVGTAAHEFLHAILLITRKDKGEGVFDALSQQLTTHVSGLDSNNINNQRIQNRLKSYEGRSDKSEEVITIMSEGILDGSLSYNETFFTKIGDSIRQFFRQRGIGKYEFNTGRDVYNFIKDYNASIQSGVVNESILNVAVEGAKGKLVDAKKETDIKSMPKSSFSLSADERIRVEKEVTDIGNTYRVENGKETWDQGGADITIQEIRENKYFDNLIASKYKGDRVPVDFVDKVYAELTSHIKNFNPEVNDNLFGYINSQVANKAGNVYNREYKATVESRAVDIDAKTTEGAPVIQIEDDPDTEITRIEEEDLSLTKTPETSKLRKALKLTNDLVEKVRSTVVKTFGTRLPDIDTKKFKQALQKAYRTELKKPIQNFIGTKNKYENFLNKHAQDIFKAFPVQTLVQFERNLPADQRIFTTSRRITKPTEVDELISKGLLPKDTNRLSGPQLHTKKSFPGLNKMQAFFRGIDMEAQLGYKVGASTLGTRKDKLAMELGVEFAFDATSETIRSKEVQEKRQGILQLEGKEQALNEVAIIAKQIDRDPNIAFSFDGDKKPARYTGTAFINHANILLKDINEQGYDAVIIETVDDETGEVSGKLVEGYEDLDIPQFTVNVIVNLNAVGDIETAASIGFKSNIKSFKKLFPKQSETIDKYLSTGNLRYADRDGKGDLKQLSIDAGIIANALGQKVMDTVGWEILGYKNRIMDPASKKVDKQASKKSDKNPEGKTVYQKNSDGSNVTGDYYNKLQSQQNDVKGKEGSILPKGLILSDVNIMNITVTGSLFKDIAKILKKVSKQEKLDAIAKLKPKIDAANKANILLAKHIAKTIIVLAKQGKINKISALHLLQSQTSIVSGYRGLSRLDLIDVREGSQAVNENHPSYKEAVKYYKIKGFSEADAKVEALKKLAFKGEHLGPNANTMAEIAKLIFDDNVDIDAALNKVFRGHSQMLTSKYITDVIDDKGGKNNNTDFNRVKFLNKSDIEAMVSAANESYIEVLANHEINILLEDLFIDKSNAVKVQELQSKPTSISYSKSKGMSTFDFDETLIIGGNNLVVAKKGDETIRIKSSEWPKLGDKLANQGYTFDFSDFVNVKGGSDGPLLQKMRNQIKKYGSDNVFVLTARMQEAAVPIHEWLKSKNINIPLQNITGLGDSTGEAKAQWMLEKFAEGYNDMYFVDDAMSNVRAVKQVLDNLDIKSKVVQAKISFSLNADQEFNNIIERAKGIDASKKISASEAIKLGRKNDKFRFFVPPSAEDFKGLIYGFLGKGKQGEKDLKFFKDNLFDTFAKATKELNSIKQKMSEEYSALKNRLPNVVSKLQEEIEGTNFSVDNAIRVYLWNKNNIDIPGISQEQIDALVEYVETNAEVQNYADALQEISRHPEGYLKPNDYWITQNISSDLIQVANKVHRQLFLNTWTDNKNKIFSPDNLNKIEAAYGSSYREALENILYRMETGSNRPSGQDGVVNKFLNWINGSVGAIMFFNTRSAVLQTLSTVNFINFQDNNIFKAAARFADQEQFWKDFSFIYNSDMLKQRRAGLKIDVNAAELSNAYAQGGSKSEAVIKYLLEKGFLPTQIADSFAISAGGSTFYRNRVNKYIKEGKSKAEAEQQAFLDFQEIAEETQQSSRPDLISMQQAGVLGRIILAFQNTPMQMTRLTKKAVLDLINNRGDFKANVSKILYYGAIQNIIFGSLQTALVFSMFGTDEKDEEKEARKARQEVRVLNGLLDTLLRGTGVYGAAAATLKNVIIKWNEETNKGFGKQDLSKVTQEIVNLSPPIGSKVRKIMSAIKSYEYNKNIIDKMDHGINNPKYNIFSNVVEAITNLPLARVRNKLDNINEAVTGNHELWQRAALTLGWNKWDLGIKDADIEKAREEVKEEKKEERKQKTKASKPKKFRCRAVKSDGKRCKNMTTNKRKRCYAHI